ncbi:hypothetical protein [Deinococcus petrolearius]|uniref:Uncharacterized protein n=1 Tax=Deinococcus petrolearius TaxID=1751295 RepID=A0ABW1DGX5_9DEIO
MSAEGPFEMKIAGGSEPASYVTLPDGSPGVEVRGVAFALVRDAGGQGLSGDTDDQRRVLDALRRDHRLTSEAPVLSFGTEERA